MMVNCRSLMLPSDVIHVKTLSKFRFVSKPWYDLISSPIFIQSHHFRSKQNPLLLTTITGGKELHLTSLDKKGELITEFVKPMPGRHVFLLFTPGLDLVCIHDFEDISICNPATQELITLPGKSFEEPLNYGPQEVVFGYMPSTKEYKVLQVFDSGKKFSYWLCEVFTFSATSHAVGKPPFEYLSHGPFRNGAFANGAAYMLPDYNAQPFSDGIARFDFQKEEWSAVLPPASGNIFLITWFVILSQVGGLLCLVDFGTNCYEIVDLWFLKDYEKSIWEKEYSIDISSLNRRKVSGVLVFPIAIQEDGRILLEVLDEMYELHYYDSRTKTYEKINPNNKGWSGSTFFVESFISLEKW